MMLFQNLYITECGGWNAGKRSRPAILVGDVGTFERLIQNRFRHSPCRFPKHLMIFVCVFRKNLAVVSVRHQTVHCIRNERRIDRFAGHISEHFTIFIDLNNIDLNKP